MKPITLLIALSMLAIACTSCKDKSVSTSQTTENTEVNESKEAPAKQETITLGGGCFWCVEAVYQQIDGVETAISGYMGGTTENPSYEEVCTVNNGHVEVVQLKYDPDTISLSKVLEWFWALHDPTTLNRQGNDSGPQYASVIFYHSDEQKKIAEESLESAQSDFSDPIVTRIEEAPAFYVAEDIHQDYYFLNKNKNPYCQAIISPKLEKLKLEQ